MLTADNKCRMQRHGCLMQGVKASDRALASYCMLHRLSLALVEDFHLLPAVLARLDRFQSHRACRVKTEVPALGSLLALLSLTPATRHSWLNLVSLTRMISHDRRMIQIHNQTSTHIFPFLEHLPGMAVAPTRGGGGGGGGLGGLCHCLHIPRSPLLPGIPGSSW